VRKIDTAEDMQSYLNDVHLHEKWAFLTEGLGDRQKSMVSCLLENQEKFGGIMQNANNFGGATVVRRLQNGLSDLTEAETNTSDIIDFQKVAFPMIRKIWANSPILDLVSVQPMTLPLQKLFYLDFLAGDTNSLHTQKTTSFYDETLNGVTGIGPDPAYTQASTSAQNASQPGTLEYPNSPRTATMKVTAAIVDSITRKLKAEWSLEAADELRAYHGMNFEREITGAMSTIIRRDIEKDVLDDLLSEIATNVAVNTDLDVSIQDVAIVGDDTFRTLQANITAAVADAKAAVYGHTFHHPTWWLVGTGILKALDRMDDFIPSSNITNTADRSFVGTYKDLRVYRDPFMSDNLGIMGYQGSGMMETGYIYAPYIPLLITPSFFNPGNMGTVKGVFSQYGKKMIKPNFFARTTLLP